VPSALSKTQVSTRAVVFLRGARNQIGGHQLYDSGRRKLVSDQDAWDEAIALDRNIESVAGARRLRLVILDACRDNSFVSRMKRLRQAVRSVSAGLGTIQPPGTDTLMSMPLRRVQLRMMTTANTVHDRAVA
jgi:hypothetical protein